MLTVWTMLIEIPKRMVLMKRHDHCLVLLASAISTLIVSLDMALSDLAAVPPTAASGK